MSLAKELCEKRLRCAEDMKVLVAAGLKTPEDRKKWDDLDVEQKGYKAQIERISASEALETELRGTKAPESEQPGAPNNNPTKTKEERAKEYQTAFFRALSRGSLRGNLQTEMLRWNSGDDAANNPLKATLDRGREERMAELRDQEAGTQSISYTQGVAGGYFVPAGFVYDVEIATKYYCPLADGSIIRIMETATGNVLPYPTNNDTNEAWQVIGESVAMADQGQTPNYPTPGTAPSGQPGNLTAGVVNFGAWKGSTGLIPISLELLQDSAFNLEDFLKNAFAVRMGRGYEYFLTRGTGVNQPTGILTAVVASGQAATIATGSSSNDGTGATGTNSIGTNDLIALEHSIDPTYRRGGRFMFHDSTLKSIKQLLDKYGRPLWVPGLAANAPDTVLGYQYVINQSMPVIASGSNTILFGSLQKFIMRKVRDLSILRLDERFAEKGQVAFIAFSRIDSNLIDAGVHPIGYLQQHS